jgi:orotidine 5'-phosphate decarboxylase subfamily 1
LLDFLKQSGNININEYEKVTTFLQNNQVQIEVNDLSKGNPDVNLGSEMTFEERKQRATCQVVRKLLETMDEKQSNLCVAVDVPRASELLKIADNLGQHICCLKTHVDIILDWPYDLGLKLRELANKHSFLLFEDRKFADIGTTVSHQYHGGPFRISSWADLVTVHALPGPGVLQGLENRVELDSTYCDNRPKGALILAQMSSSGNLLSDEYSQKCVEMYKQWRDKNLDVPPIGFIGQSRMISGDPNFIQMTPGVSMVSKGDNLGQNYVSVESAIREKGADIIIVGRGITSCADEKTMKEMARKYKKLAWDAFLDKTS